MRTAADWFGHLSLLELGLGGALAPLIAMAMGRRDEHQVRRTVIEGIRAYARVALAATFAGLVVALVIERLVPVSASLVSELRTGALIAALGLLLYPLAPFRGFADASQRGYVINLTLLAQSLTTTALALFLAWQGWGITGQFLALLAGQSLFALVITRDGLRRQPGLLKAAATEPRDEATRAQIRKLNFSTFFFDLSGRMGLLTDNIVIALILGAGNVTPLFLTQRLAALAQTQLQGVGNASWASLSELHALGRRDVFNARLLELTRLVAALGVATLLPIAAHNAAFIALWVGSEHYGGHLVTVLAATNALLLSLVSLWGWCFSGTGQVATLVPIMLISATINLAVSVTGAFTIGLPGPLLGTFVAILSTTLWYLPLQLQRKFGAGAGALLRAAFGPLAWAAIPGAAIAWLAVRYPPQSWWMLGLRAGGSVLVLLLVWWIFELRAEERAHYLKRLRMAGGRQ